MSESTPHQSSGGPRSESAPSGKGPAGRRQKGFFSRIGLPISPGYVKPEGRSRLLAVGLLLAAVAGVFALLDSQLAGSRHLSGGPLSSAHATLQSDCSSCHGLDPAGGLAVAG